VEERIEAIMHALGTYINKITQHFCTPYLQPKITLPQCPCQCFLLSYILFAKFHFHIRILGNISRIAKLLKKQHTNRKHTIHLIFEMAHSETYKMFSFPKRGQAFLCFSFLHFCWKQMWYKNIKIKFCSH
jgi:hypothetical protein